MPRGKDINHDPLFGHHPQCHFWQKPKTEYHNKHLTVYQPLTMMVQGGDLGFFCSHWIWETCSH